MVVVNKMRKCLFPIEFDLFDKLFASDSLTVPWVKLYEVSQLFLKLPTHYQNLEFTIPKRVIK